MKTTISTLVLALTAILLLTTNGLKCQIIYTDVEPDTTITIPSVLDAPSQVFNFNLDSNGNYDFGFGARYKTLGVYITRQSLATYLAGTQNAVSGACWFGFEYSLNEFDTIDNNLLWYPQVYFEYIQSGSPPPCMPLS